MSNEATDTWYRSEHTTCNSCGESTGWPPSKEWVARHLSTWHTLKYWLKRRLGQ